LLDSLRHNLNRNNQTVALFEIGRVFTPALASQSAAPAADGVGEGRRVAVALIGNRNALFWTGEERYAKFDIYDVKGVLDEVFEQFGLRGHTYTRRPESSSLFLESATIQLGKDNMGDMSQLL